MAEAAAWTPGTVSTRRTTWLVKLSTFAVVRIGAAGQRRLKREHVARVEAWIGGA